VQKKKKKFLDQKQKIEFLDQKNKNKTEFCKSRERRGIERVENRKSHL
jgi:hypothetical protein